MTIEEADGNYVILEIEDGVFAFYAHLKPGSVEVETGDTVGKGDVIARTGNSGSSTGPHLHFQLVRLGPFVTSAQGPRIGCIPANSRT